MSNSKWSIDNVGATGYKISVADGAQNAINFEADGIKNGVQFKDMAQAFSTDGNKFGQGTLHVEVPDQQNPLRGDVRPATPRLTKSLVGLARDMGDRNLNIISRRGSEVSDSE